MESSVIAVRLYSFFQPQGVRFTIAHTEKTHTYWQKLAFSKALTTSDSILHVVVQL